MGLPDTKADVAQATMEAIESLRKGGHKKAIAFLLECISDDILDEDEKDLEIRNDEIYDAAFSFNTREGEEHDWYLTSADAIVERIALAFPKKEERESLCGVIKEVVKKL